ncbi:hypothetical protein LTR62_005116 [Meristemomyces frigidus]|uniref:Glutaredoxin domain-containing protein n=1 Tax=Meristemomyces frigidus TaxID=1508187 RepID=A0AAN7YSC0_9PEZI|nr:hypothetical protein LTR62_005116 [Meristemomyces frigidus]
MATSAAMDLSSLDADPRLFLYTSLTAGSSHIITATSRLETILKANKIPFQAIDTATDEKARRLWQRRAAGKKLPGLVKEGFVLGDLEEIEEWNEFGELKENIGPVPEGNAAPPGGQVGINIAPLRPLPVKTTSTAGTAKLSQPPSSKAPSTGLDETKSRAMPVALPGAAEIAARSSKVAKDEDKSEGKDKDEATAASAIDAPPNPETMNSAAVDKEASLNAAKEAMKGQKAGVEHLSAPASRLHSGTATPAEGEGESVSTAAGSNEEKAAPADVERESGATATKGNDEKATPAEVESGSAATAASETKEKTTPTETETKSENAATVTKADAEKTTPAVADTESENAATATTAATSVNDEKTTSEEKETEGVQDLKTNEQKGTIPEAAKEVDPLQSSEAEKTPNQPAASGDEATKSVED